MARKMTLDQAILEQQQADNIEAMVERTEHGLRLKKQYGLIKQLKETLKIIEEIAEATAEAQAMAERDLGQAAHNAALLLGAADTTLQVAARLIQREIAHHEGGNK